LKNVEEFTRATIKKLTQGMAENNKSMANAKTDEEKEKIVSFIPWFVHFVLYGIMGVSHLHFYMMLQKTKKQNATTGLRTCNNILTMTKVKRMLPFSFYFSK
jgi:hypothetical protein